MARNTTTDIRSHEGAGQNAPQIITADSDMIDLPDSSYVRDADLTRDGMDLLIEGPEGAIVVENYFAAEPAPQLIAPDGARLTPDLVDSFVGGGHEYASLDGMNDASPVGGVSEITGEATVTRVDGTVETVTLGTPIFQGDVVETGASGAVNIVFADETEFAVSEDARLAIDEYVYDPATGEGAQNFSVLKGVFVFTSGIIGREDPDDVVIETPVGSIGIRGTVIAGDVTQGEITVVEGAIVLTDFGGNTVTLANQFETAKFTPGGGVENIGTLSATDVAGKFASVSGVAANLFSSIGDAAAQEAANDGGNADADAGADSEAAADGEAAGEGEASDAAAEGGEGEAAEAGEGEAAKAAEAASEGEAAGESAGEAQGTEAAADGGAEGPAGDAPTGEASAAEAPAAEAPAAEAGASDAPAGDAPAGEGPAANGPGPGGDAPAGDGPAPGPATAGFGTGPAASGFGPAGIGTGPAAGSVGSNAPGTGSAPGDTIIAATTAGTTADSGTQTTTTTTTTTTTADTTINDPTATGTNTTAPPPFSATFLAHGFDEIAEGSVVSAGAEIVMARIGTVSGETLSATDFVFNNPPVELTNGTNIDKMFIRQSAGSPSVWEVVAKVGLLTTPEEIDFDHMNGLTEGLNGFTITVRNQTLNLGTEIQSNIQNVNEAPVHISGNTPPDGSADLNITSDADNENFFAVSQSSVFEYHFDKEFADRDFGDTLTYSIDNVRLNGGAALANGLTDAAIAPYLDLTKGGGDGWEFDPTTGFLEIFFKNADIVGNIDFDIVASDGVLNASNTYQIDMLSRGGTADLGGAPSINGIVGVNSDFNNSNDSVTLGATTSVDNSTFFFNGGNDTVTVDAADNSSFYLGQGDDTIILGQGGTVSNSTVFTGYGTDSVDIKTGNNNFIYSTDGSPGSGPSTFVIGSATASSDNVIVATHGNYNIDVGSGTGNDISVRHSDSNSIIRIGTTGLASNTSVDLNGGVYNVDLQQSDTGNFTFQNGNFNTTVIGSAGPSNNNTITFGTNAVGDVNIIDGDNNTIAFHNNNHHINVNDASINNTINGGYGDEVFDIREENNKFHGNEGDDKFILNFGSGAITSGSSMYSLSSSTVVYDGGGDDTHLYGGFGDTLEIFSSMDESIDFTAFSDIGIFQNLETIDFGTAMNNMVTLDFTSIFQITDGDNRLIIKSGDDSGDTLHLDFSAGETATNQGTKFVNGEQFDSYEITDGTNTVSLLIENTVTQSGDIAGVA